MNKKIKHIYPTKTFSKHYKRALNRGKDKNKLREVVDMLVNREPLPPKYKDHPLKGKYKGSNECHIEPDWLLVYRIDNNQLILELLDTGTHADLFK